jgi:hypothetical protein
LIVAPAKAGAQLSPLLLSCEATTRDEGWIPAFAGMTNKKKAGIAAGLFNSPRACGVTCR